MVARTIHNLKVAGLNLEGGNIFSERYLARKGGGRERKLESAVELQRRKEYGEK